MDKYKDYSSWMRKSSTEYQKEIVTLRMENDKLKKQLQIATQTSTKWGEGVWEQTCHELVWAIGLLESNPTSPKAWRKMFNVLKVYENLEKTKND